MVVGLLVMEEVGFMIVVVKGIDVMIVKEFGEF